ncbi:MAG: hypothetical protein ACFE9T_07500 [Promethearchaeota archaeon]
MSSGNVEQESFENFFGKIRLDQSFNFANIELQKNNLILQNREIFKSEEIHNDYFEMVKKIHSILSNNSNLTNKMKFDFCISQRSFMKLYLKEILNKY